MSDYAGHDEAVRLRKWERVDWSKDVSIGKFLFQHMGDGFDKSDHFEIYWTSGNRRMHYLGKVNMGRKTYLPTNYSDYQQRKIGLLSYEMSWQEVNAEFLRVVADFIELASNEWKVEKKG